MPKWIDEAPELFLGLEIYWLAFHELSTCRNFGMGVGPIPFTALVEYARTFEFSREQTDSLIYFMRVMDETYLDYTKKQQNSTSSSKSKTPLGKKGTL